MSAKLYNPVAERSLISGLLLYGKEAFYEMDDIIEPNCFWLLENKVLFETIQKLIFEFEIDTPSTNEILSKIEEDFVQEKSLVGYIEALYSDLITLENIKPNAKVVSKLSFCRNLQKRLEIAREDLESCDGSEPLQDILNIAENPILSFNNAVIQETGIICLPDLISDYIETAIEGDGSHRGIPSGFDKFDYDLGGGFRKPGNHVIGARSKVGKSFLAVNIIENVTKLGIPVLYLDTEMTEDMTIARWLACISGVETDTIEMGLFSENENESKRIQEAMREASNRPLYYDNISGKHHKHWIASIRKWIMQTVGFDENGETKDCLIVLDYLKMMDMGDLGSSQEYQYLGQIMTDLHNICRQFNVAMVSFSQLNRDGIDNDGEGVIAGSDRILWLCGSLSLLRDKTAEDLVSDPPNNGNKKLSVIRTRFGVGTEMGTYINLKTDLSKAFMEEGLTNREARLNLNNSIDIENDEPIEL